MAGPRSVRMRRQPPVEPIDVREEHVYACFDALLAHLNGTDAPAVPFQDAVWHVSLPSPWLRMSLTQQVSLLTRMQSVLRHLDTVVGLEATRLHRLPGCSWYRGRLA